jgi:hypothetical protein
MLYEKLSEPMQEMVDHYAEKARTLPWTQTSNLIGEASKQLSEEFTGRQARVASRGFLTAVLERLEPAEVNDPLQACLFTLSLNPEHRRMADQYLDQNPEVREMLDAEMDEDLPVN